MEEGISVKDLENLSDDKKRNKDLEELKFLGGPFRNVEEVNLFMSKPMDEKSRNHRLYIEVCYARRTCLHYPKNSPLFSLKKNYLNLDSTTYAANIKTYLSKLICHVEMDMKDFQTAIDSL